MIIKVNITHSNPRLLATAVVKGGLLYSRVARANRIQELTHGGDYSRVVREWIPRRSNRDWKTPRSQRVSYSPGRTVRFNRPPAYQRKGAHLLKKHSPPEGWGLPLDGEPGAVAYWEKKFHRVSAPLGADGTPYLNVCHRGGAKFKAWAISRNRHGYSLWGYRPRKEQDPLRAIYDYLSRGGFSFLGGLRGSTLSMPPLARLDFRLSRLYRRRREHNLLNYHLETLVDYRILHWGKRRRKLSPLEAQFFLFRRRRLRGYLTGKVTHRNYINRLTRRGFYRWHPNRWSRLERATLLGGSYVEPRTTWGSYLLGSRVSTPLEYHLYNPFAGFGRIIKRRREGSRRWKLGQHSFWGLPHLNSRQAKWSWFKETPLGILVNTFSTGKEPSPKNEPHEGHLEGALYWSARKWGRSRWDRPTPRGTRGFIYSLKGGNTVELDSQQWGKAGTSGVGIFLSLVAEQELRVPTQQFEIQTQPLSEVSSSRKGSFYSRFVSFAFREVLYFSKITLWKVLTFFWRLFIPFWWLYSKVALLICWVSWWVRQGALWIYALLTVIPNFLSHFFWQSLVLPARDYITHWVKDTSFVKAVGWVWTSWMLVYSSDDDQRKLDVNTVHEAEDGSQEYYLDDVDRTGESDPDSNDDDEVDIHEGAPRLPTKENWQGGLDFGVEAGLDAFYEFILEEIPYWVGFVLQPFIDFCLRLPLWAFLEGASLLSLTVKLEFQRLWSKLLNKGGGPHRGRWWKVPLLLVKNFLHFLLWISIIWFVGSTLHYSTLRLEVVLWGWPWREEYYFFWWLLVTLLVTKVVGPTGLKNFAFNDIGWSNWLGLFGGAVEIAAPEEYYPGRPLSLLNRAATTAVGMPMRRHKTYDDVVTIYREDGAYLGGPHNTGYDEIAIILARKYENSDNPNWEEVDEANYFNFPIHLPHSLDATEITDSFYGNIWSELPGNEFRNRGREPHLVTNNYYDLSYNCGFGRPPPPIYFINDLHNAVPLRDYLAKDTELRVHGRDESLENSSVFNENS